MLTLHIFQIYVLLLHVFITSVVLLLLLLHLSYFILQNELRFEQALKEKRGFIIKRMGEDGACLFRSVGKYM